MEKKKSLIETKRDITEIEVLNIAIKEPKIEKNLQNKKIKKTIFVKNRLINFII